MTNLKIFSRNIVKLGKRYFLDRNPFDKILFFNSKVLMVNKEAQLQRKFRTPINCKPDNFVYFPKINLQLSLLFTTQIQFLHVILDIYNQMCEDYFEFIKKSKRNFNQRHLPTFQFLWKHWWVFFPSKMEFKPIK